MYCHIKRVYSQIVVLSLVLSPCSAQAPGDGDEQCTGASNAPTYPDNEKTLMDSYHYLQLLPGNGTGNIIPGAVWNDRSVDGNDRVDTINPTYVSTHCVMFSCHSTSYAIMLAVIFVYFIYNAVAARCWRNV